MSFPSTGSTGVPAESPPSSGDPSSKFTRAQGMTLLAAFLGWMFDGLEMGIFPLIARPALQQMLGPGGESEIGKWMGIITALFLGAALGGFVFGWLGDRIGRIKAMSASILVYSLFTGVGYWAVEPWHLGALRFIAALGMGGEWALGVALVMETWPSSKRPMLAGLIGAASNIGFALIGFVGILFSITQTSWRWVLLAGTLPALLTFFIRLFVPESEKWKAAAAKGGPSPVRELITSGHWKVCLFATALASMALIGTWGSVQWLPLWADQMAGKPEAKAYTQMLSALGAVVGCLVGGWVGVRAKRRVAFFFLSLLSLLACAVLFRTEQQYGVKFLALVFLVGGLTASFYGWLPLYLPELFPTRIRATAQGFSYNFGRVLAAVGALQMSNLMAHYNGSYAKAGATITLIYLVGLVIIWFGPETKDRPLMD